MTKGIVALALVIALGTSSVQAEQPAMSKAKLSSLGLANLEPATDEAGMQVRGMGRSFASGAFIATTGTAASGILAYSFANRKTNALSAGEGIAVSNFSHIVNAQTFTFSARAYGSSIAFGP